MFRSIVSRLSFSPALVGQLSFYAKRLRKEQVTRRLGLIFTALALVVQSLAVFQAPEPANAASRNDIVYGGVKTVKEFLSLYDKNSQNLKDIMNSFGITRAEIAATKYEVFTVGKKFSWGRHARSFDAGSKQILNSKGQHIDTIYGRPMSKMYKRGEASRAIAFTGHSKAQGWFGIILDCGNLVLDRMPPPPPKPKNIKVCRLSDFKVITINEKNFDSKKHSKNTANCKAPEKSIKVCNLATLKIVTIKEGQFDSKKHSKNIKDCDPKLIEVCDLLSLETITIDEKDFDSKRHSKNPEDCVPEPEPGNLELSKTATNLTQGNIDATKTTAQSDDRITYTLAVHNSGGTPMEATFEDSIFDVLEYSTLIDTGGGTFDKTAESLSWPDVTIEPGATEYRKYTVRLASSIPASPIGISDLTSYDCVMDNVFGNGIAIDVNCPAPKVVENVVEELPKTGPGENITFAAVVFSIVTFFYYRSKQLNKEVRLIRRNLNAGAL